MMDLSQNLMKKAIIHRFERFFDFPLTKEGKFFVMENIACGFLT